MHPAQTTPRQRLLKTLNGEKPDRVPISLYEFEGDYEFWIHKYPECEARARLHSHGKVKKVLNSFLEMGIDAVDPVERPPETLFYTLRTTTLLSKQWGRPQGGKHAG